MEKELVVSLSYLVQVFESYAALVFLIPFFNSLVKYFGTGLQVDHQIGFGHPGIQKRVDLLVQVQFFDAQRQSRENSIFFKKILGDNILVKEILLT